MATAEQACRRDAGRDGRGRREWPAQRVTSHRQEECGNGAGPGCFVIASWLLTRWRPSHRKTRTSTSFPTSAHVHVHSTRVNAPPLLVLFFTTGTAPPASPPWVIGGLVAHLHEAQPRRGRGVRKRPPFARHDRRGKRGGRHAAATDLDEPRHCQPDEAIHVTVSNQVHVGGLFGLNRRPSLVGMGERRGAWGGRDARHRGGGISLGCAGTA